MRASIVLLAASLSLAACGSSAGRKIVLSPEGNAVRVEAHAPEGASCREIGDVFGKFESTDQEQAMIGAKIDIRNRAAKLGADLVVLQTNNGSTRQDSFNGMSMGVHYGILLGGKALKCVEAQPAAAAPAPGASAPSTNL